MRFLFSLFVSFFTVYTLTIRSSFAQEIDLDAGAQIFSDNCAACHIGGNNSVNPTKTLKLEVLHEFSRDSFDAIKYQVSNGGGGMPAFGDKFSEEEICNVASFVLDTAKNNSW
uniref:Cytochrome c-553 n=1 Tax=Symphyocladiella dendroidea TaxID=2506487 RepID=A0A1Z1M6R7_9FLOR|nr:cytochrome c553 [Symphyocladiella dendroidea]ARW61787.1 cytochrome c553 [Symphyocladiella dendroidea]